VTARLALAAALACSLLVGAHASAQDLRPATFCGACHGPIRRDWEKSAMGQSWKNPVFQAFLSDAKAALGDSTLAGCISCHAPAASVTADYKFEASVSREGVTCNFCHNVSDVDPSPKPASYTFDPNHPLLMRGPYSDADPGKAHDFVYSKIHTKGEFCAACHDHASEGGTGVPIETTYDRWKASDAASEGEQCQDCHMAPYSGQAAPHLSKMTRDKVYSHAFHAARTPGFLDSVATMTAAVEGGRLKLTIANQKAGHSLPGGGGGMRVIGLSVSFYGAAGESLGTTDVQTYGIRYADAKGVTPVPKWLAKTVAHQAEIPSQGTATEWCDIPAKAKRAEAKLVYYPFDPAYLPSLAARRVDLSARQPVVMARSSAKLP
jgi:cytochrome c554/c'-like protein